MRMERVYVNIHRTYAESAGERMVVIEAIVADLLKFKKPRRVKHPADKS